MMTMSAPPDVRWRHCPKCGQYKNADTAFYRTRGHARCRECSRAEMRARIAPLREWVTAYKLEHGCVECGYREHPAALEFDHLPGFEKTEQVSLLILGRATLERVKEEIAKCELVCANCHRIRTAERGDRGADHDLRRRGIVPSNREMPPFEQLSWEV